MLSRCVDFCAQRKMRYNGQAQRPLHNTEIREQAGRGTPKAAQRGGRPTARPPRYNDAGKSNYFEWEPGGRPTTAGGQAGSPKGGQETTTSPASARGRRSGGPAPRAPRPRAGNSRRRDAPDRDNTPAASALAPIKPLPEVT